MISYPVILFIQVAIVLLFTVCFGETLKKFSWKFFVCLLVLTKIPDIISTVVAPNFAVEGNPLVCWMQAITNFPEIVVLLIHGVIIVSFCLFVIRLMWNESRFGKVAAKAFALSFSIGSIFVVISNFGI